MENVTFFFTSKPLPGKNPDTFEQDLSESLQNEMHSTDKNARVKCMTLVLGNTIFITGEVAGQNEPKRSLKIRDVVNKIYDQYAHEHR